MDLIYLDGQGFYICRLCAPQGRGDSCAHLAPMHRAHNRRVQREAKR